MVCSNGWGPVHVCRVCSPSNNNNNSKSNNQYLSVPPSCLGRERPPLCLRFVQRSPDLEVCGLRCWYVSVAAILRYLSSDSFFVASDRWLRRCVVVVLNATEDELGPPGGFAETYGEDTGNDTAQLGPFVSGLRSRLRLPKTLSPACGQTKTKSGAR